jgi:hypothetical protein
VPVPPSGIPSGVECYYKVKNKMLRTQAGQTISVETTRATFTPGTSICRQLPSFETVDDYPIRSPLAVADFLAPIVAGRRFTEIGTRNGDIMSCLAHFAQRMHNA